MVPEPVEQVGGTPAVGLADERAPLVQPEGHLLGCFRCQTFGRGQEDLVPGQAPEPFGGQDGGQEGAQDPDAGFRRGQEMAQMGHDGGRRRI